MRAYFITQNKQIWIKDIGVPLPQFIMMDYPEEAPIGIFRAIRIIQKRFALETCTDIAVYREMECEEARSQR